MTDEHRHAGILRAIADGKEVEFYSQCGYGWATVISSQNINPITNPNYNFRIKSQEIETKWGNITKPFHPSKDEHYWTLDCYGEPAKYCYVLDVLDTHNTSIGFVWKTREDVLQAKEVISKMMWS